MDKERISPTFNLTLVGCLIFDFAIILAFFKIFGLFLIVIFSKSLCAMLVLLLGLAASNVAVVAPNILFKNVNLPFSNAISVLLILYACIANVASVFCKTFLHNIAKKKYTPLRLKFFSDYFGLDRAFLSRKLSPVKLKMCA